MSSDVGEFYNLLGIPAASFNLDSMSDDNIFDPRTSSFDNPLVPMTTDEDVAKTVERCIEGNFKKIEESFRQVVRRETTDLYTLSSANSIKTDQILQLLNDRSMNTHMNGRNSFMSTDGFDSCVYKDSFSKVESVLSEGNSIQSNHNNINHKEFFSHRLDVIEKRLDTICDHTQASTKKLGQDILDLGNNVDQRVGLMEKKLDSISEGMGKIEKKYETETNEKNRVMADLHYINETVTKLSEETKQSNSIFDTNINEVRCNIANIQQKLLLQSTTCDKKKKCDSDSSSSSSSDESYESSGDKNSTKTKASIRKQLNTLCSEVEAIKEKINSWQRYAKKAIQNSDENTNVMLERFVSLEKTLQNSTLEDKVLHKNIVKKLEDLNNNSTIQQSANAQGFLGMDEKLYAIISTIEGSLNNDWCTIKAKNVEETNALLEKHHNALNVNFKALEQLINNFTSNKVKQFHELELPLKDIYKNSQDLLNRVIPVLGNTHNMQKQVEDGKANNISHAKTLATINSSLRTIKTNNTKLLGQMKEMKTLSLKQGDSTKSNALTKNVIQDYYQSSIQNIRDLYSESFDTMKNMFSELEESRHKSNVSQKDFLGGKAELYFSDDALQQVVDVIHHQNFFKDMTPENLQNYLQKPTFNLINAMTLMENKLGLLQSDVNQHQKMVTEVLTNLLTEIAQKPCNTEIEHIHKQVSNEMEETLINDYLKHTAKLSEEIEKQRGLNSEILNSVEDLKMLTSSTPNTIHDLFPLVEDISQDIGKIRDDIGSYIAGFEENLCIHLETKVKGIQQVSLQNISGRFDTLDHRMAVIRKYVKYGSRTTSNDD